MEKIPEKIEGTLDLSYRNDFILPEKTLEVEGGLDLSGCTGLSKLPENLKIKRELYTDNPRLYIPYGVIKGDIYLNDKIIPKPTKSMDYIRRIKNEKK